MNVSVHQRYLLVLGTHWVEALPRLWLVPCLYLGTQENINYAISTLSWALPNQHPCLADGIVAKARAV